MSEFEEPLQEDYNESQRTELTVTHKQMMDEAWDSLSGNWGIAVATELIYLILISMSGAVHSYFQYILGGPFAIGLAIFSMKFARNEEANISNLFDGFPDFARAIGAYILMMIAIILGTLCLIVPGIMLAYGLAKPFIFLLRIKKLESLMH